MKSIEPALARYLNELGIGGASFKHIDDARRKLPVFLAKSYEFRVVRLFNRPFVMLLRLSERPPTPAEALKHADLVRGQYGQEVIFVLPNLKSFDRRRWIENGLPFIVPGKFFYCPLHLLDFRESARNHVRVFGGERDSLSAATQALLLAYLQHDPPCANLADWADYLHYTRMTVSRASRELEGYQLCEAKRSGKSMTLQFRGDKKSLWEQALPLLRSPVLRTKRVDILDQSDLKLLQAGISALSDLSMLAPDHESTYAMSSAAYKAAFEAGQIAEASESRGGVAIIEQWSYAPAVLAAGHRTVDRLSLYLSLQDNPDERVQGELRSMLEGVPW